MQLEQAFPPQRGADLNRALVCLFITHEARRITPSTLGGTLSALADWQRSKGLPAEAAISRDPVVRRTLAQATRLAGSSGTAAAGDDPSGGRPKEPLPLGLLQLLVGWLYRTGLQQAERATACTQDACWLVVGFFGMLRRSELAALTVGNVRLLEGGGAEIFIARSKTDQRGEGAWVCLAERSGSKVPIGRILRRHVAEAERQGASAAQPLFTRQARWEGTAAPWAVGAFTTRLRTLLTDLQRDVPGLSVDVMQLSSHSLRRGGATAAANAGVGVEDIKAHGRWRSNAVEVYIRRSLAMRKAVVARM